MSAFPGVQQIFQGAVRIGRLFLKREIGITALAGGGQTGATPMGQVINRVDTVAAANASVMLPACEPGAAVLVINNNATNSMQVFSKETTGVDIDGVAGSTGVAHAAGRMGLYVATDGNWFRLPNTP